MAVVNNTSARFRSKSTDISRVMYDYEKWVERIHRRAEEKVEEAVSTITNSTNRQYASNNTQDGVTLTQDPIYYRMYVGKNTITGVAIARPIREFIYLEFGTRMTPSDTLTIQGGFESGINASAIAAPYRSENPRFFNKERIIGTYYFLDNIDLNGIKFIRGFWK